MCAANRHSQVLTWDFSCARALWWLKLESLEGFITPGSGAWAARPGIAGGQLDLPLSMSLSNYLAWTSSQNGSLSLIRLLTRQLDFPKSIPQDLGWSCTTAYNFSLKVKQCHCIVVFGSNSHGLAQIQHRERIASITFQEENDLHGKAGKGVRAATSCHKVLTCFFNAICLSTT